MFKCVCVCCFCGGICNVVNTIISIYHLFLYGLYAYDFYKIVICRLNQYHSTPSKPALWNQQAPLLSPLRCWTKAEESGAHARGTPPHHAQRFLEGGTCQKSRIHSAMVGAMVGAMVAWETFFFPTIFFSIFNPDLGNSLSLVMLCTMSCSAMVDRAEIDPASKW